MNEVPENKKRPSLKLLAITAFIGIIALVAWFSVQLVNNMPEAFSSLASLAESVNPQTLIKEDKPKEHTDLVVTSNTTLINTQETVELSWNTTKTPGSYTFAYTCTDGVAINIIEGINSNQNVTCDTNYNIGNINSLKLYVESEKSRFENINYIISFMTTSESAPSVSGAASFMVVNSAIAGTSVAEEEQNIDEDESVVTDNEEETEVVNKQEEEVAMENTPETETPEPVYEQEFIYTIPSSDPNGRVDLATRFITTGKISGNTFTPESINQNQDGAIQFEVKNIGTKTSRSFKFSVAMPDSSTYESKSQEPLKPNERAVLTIGFIGEDKPQHTFMVKVEEATDTYPANNNFSELVKFVK